jgi:hypothetical protein
VRKIAIFGSLHKYQETTPINPFYRQHLRELVNDHRVDVILEEATGLPPKSCVEVLADTLGIAWKNVDLSRDERKLVASAATSPLYDTFEDLNLHRCREWVWAVRISAAVVDSGLMVCGLCHVFSLAEKLRWIGFDVEPHVYDPRRDEPRI